MKRNSNNLVLCDRYWQSSAIYCGANANATTIDEINALYLMLHKKPLFDEFTYVYLKISEDTSLNRAYPPDVPNQWATRSFCKRARSLYNLVYNQLELISEGLCKKIVIDTEKNDLDACVNQLLYIIKNEER